MRSLVTGLIAALVVAGLWGTDRLANAQSDCVALGAVSPDNTALMSDCKTLLDVRDVLAGTASLNWAPDTLIQPGDPVWICNSHMAVA